MISQVTENEVAELVSEEDRDLVRTVRYHQENEALIRLRVADRSY